MKTRSLPSELRDKLDALWKTYEHMTRQGHVARVGVRDEIEERLYQLGYDTGRVAGGVRDP